MPGLDVAILIPAYNDTAFIGLSLQSLQAQTALAKISKVYVADDASSDTTVQDARSAWQISAPGLHILEADKNLGERGNVNRAVAVIKQHADWILILHADDLAKPDWIEVMVSRIESGKPEIATFCSSWDNLLWNGTVVKGENDPSREPELITGNACTVRDTLLQGCWWHFSGAAIQIRAFEKIGEFDPQLPSKGDWEWLLRCLRTGWSVEYIPRTLIYYYRHKSSSASQSFRINRDIHERLIVIGRFKEFLTRGEYFRLHMRLLWFTVRRAGRGMLTGNFGRILIAGKTTARILTRAARY